MGTTVWGRDKGKEIVLGAFGWGVDWLAALGVCTLLGMSVGAFGCAGLVPSGVSRAEVSTAAALP